MVREGKVIPEEEEVVGEVGATCGVPRSKCLLPSSC